jgi:hypothetical protein
MPTFNIDFTVNFVIRYTILSECYCTITLVLRLICSKISYINVFILHICVECGNSTIIVVCKLLFFSLALQPSFGPWPTSMKLSVSLQFTKSQTVGRTPWMGDQLVARPLPTLRTTQTQNKRTQTSMP